jgi:CheY-like chemotaxis protein
MAKLLLIDGDANNLTRHGGTLRRAGHEVLTAASGLHGLDLLDHQTVDVVVSELVLPDIPGLDILLRVRGKHGSLPFVVATRLASARNVVAAMRLGATDVVETPLSAARLLALVRTALGDPEADRGNAQAELSDLADIDEAHAAARWARGVACVANARRDPKTIAGWSRLAYVSPGALKNWCHTAGIAPRRSLVFARLLRAVLLSHGGTRKPQDLIDVVDRRTLASLLRFGGFDLASGLPADAHEFLHRQTLVREPDALREVHRATGLQAVPAPDPTMSSRASIQHRSANIPAETS